MTGEVNNTATWLEALYGPCPGWLASWTWPDKRTAFFRTDQLARAAAHIARQARIKDTYCGTCTLSEPPARGRGGAADALAMPALWADLDVVGGVHKNVEGKLPLPTREEVGTILDDIGMPPTALIDSSGGYQAWWIFAQPLIFASTEDRDIGKMLAKRWADTLAEIGRRRGWHVDKCGDLARMLRPPGTINRKAAPKPVVLAEYHSDRRYQPADLAAGCIQPAPTPVPSRKPIRPRLRTGRESPAEAFSRIVTWGEILEPAGFRISGQQGDTCIWRHPAASSPSGTPTATTGHGAPVLVVFSESAAAVTGLPSGPGQKLTKFRVWALLNFPGPNAESDAARSLTHTSKAAR